MPTNSTVESQSEPVSAQQFDQFLLVLGGHIFFQTLSAAVQFDLFGLLKRFGSMNRSQIASQLGIAEQPARILLLGCAATGLVKKSGDSYSNTSIANTYLVRDVPGNLVSVIEWQHFINYRPMFQFFQSIKENRNVGLDELKGTESTLYGRLTHNSELEQIFQAAMQGISAQANELFAQNVNLADVKYLVDVGGGNGTNVITLAKRYPHLRATVFDSPSVCDIARKNIQECGLSDRIDAHPGDCFKDAFPVGADCIVFCHFMTIWTADENQQLLRKAQSALGPRGKAIIFNMMQSDDEDGPLTAAIGSPYFLTLATGKGMLYSWNEYETWLRSAGFSSVERKELPRDHGIVIGRK